MGTRRMEHKDAYDQDKIPFYYSRPDLRPPRLNVAVRDPERATPGLLFVAPFFSGDYQPDSGPYIFDTNGTLIWSGPSDTGGSGGSNIHDLHTCAYRGVPHICYWQGTQRGTHGTGEGVIMDQRYQVVRTVRPRAAGAGVDFHEFKLISSSRSGGVNSTSALIITYEPRFVQGTWVLDNCFEEIPLDDDVQGSRTTSPPIPSTSTPAVSFRWCATDHIPLAENPGLSSFEESAPGNGRSPDRAWDYVHLNSVDRSPSGDFYLISSRHLDAMLAISAVDGSVVWQLGGKMSSFRLEGGLSFARQHDARVVGTSLKGSPDNNSSLLISFFDNANDGVSLKDNPSRALVVRLDLGSMTAHEVAQYGGVPRATNSMQKNHLSSNGMGNLQFLTGTLPSPASSVSSAFVSFGRYGAMAEYVSPGEEPVFYANFTAPQSLPKDLQWSAGNYRTYLLPATQNTSSTNPLPTSTPIPQTWTGQPTTPPALWTYARTPNNLQTFYVSWNGDTRTHTYRFWVSDYDSPDGKTPPPATDHTLFHLAGTWPRTGFETNFTIGSARPWSYAEALSADGTSLANSSVVRTYVPAAEEAKSCGKWHCFPDVARLGAAALVPLDDAAALAGGNAGGQGGSVGLGGALDWVEHGLALVGMGFLAWWMWVRVRGRLHVRDTRGYAPVLRDEDGDMQRSRVGELKV